MPRFASSARSFVQGTSPRVVLTLGAAVGVSLLVWLLGRLGIEKGFSIDEFQYAHASWLMSRGELPYRDFFEVHFPLVYALGSLIFHAAGDAPEAMIALRWMMLPFALITCASAAVLNRSSKVAAFLAPTLLITTIDWSSFATEIRPDAVGASLFLGMLAVLSLKGSPAIRGATAGLLAGLAAASAQKAAFYVGGTAAVALVAGLLFRTHGPPRSSPLGHTPLFAVAAVAGGALAALPLLGPEMVAAFWKWAVLWGAEHQQNYPGFSWTGEVRDIARQAPLLFPLAAVGVFSTVRHRREWVLCVALLFTFLSAALQTAPFRYSFTAFLALCAVFAARGVVALGEAANAKKGTGYFSSFGKVACPLFGAALVLVHVSVGTQALLQRLEHDNREQLATLRRIGELTRPDEVAYDNSGSFVARPHVDFYFYTDKYLRSARAEALVRELPARLVERGCILKLTDAREADLPDELRRYLAEWFQPWDGDLSFWGRRYEASPATVVETRFLAPRRGRYFITPPEALEEGGIELDGRPVTAAEVTLAQGEHALRYRGARAFYLLWLPADGKHWTPAHNATPRFSRIFY